MPLRTRLASVLVAAVGATALTGPVAASAAPEETAATTTVAPRVLAAVARGGPTTFLVSLRTEADLGPAARVRGKARTTEVYRAKRAHADASQAGLRRLLADRKAAYTPYWITNTIRVTGDAALLRAVAARPEVAAIDADLPIALPTPQPGAGEPAVAATEWNIDRIGAPQVWDDYRTRGEGIVVANIDSGVQYDHPALQANYRGRQPDGSYDHNYHWYDPTGGCRTAPCDTNGHGTHTMGTMAGAEGIGVAPGVTWIAARACADNACAQTALLAAGQWILAPTDLDGRNPRPDLAPDVVNNSWGSAFYDPFYERVVSAWIAAGIFPAFSNGNSGPGCGTAGAPAAYADSYGTGAFDADNRIAAFSSRGPTAYGAGKPDIAAPGVNIRSSMPGNGYAALHGTSMASPHTAGSVALLWAAVPGLRRDVAGTRTALGEGAIDVNDTSCGGTAARNAVFGEGRLDVHAAVRLARQPVGALAGTVTAGGVPVADNPVEVTGPKSFSLRTGADGGYRLTQLPVGAYRITVGRYAYHPAERTVQITAGTTADGDIALQRLPFTVLSGTLSARDRPAAGAGVAISGTPVTGRADAAGRYRIEVPNGSYDVVLTPPDGCAVRVTRRVDLHGGDRTLDLAFAATVDRFGYTCDEAEQAYLAGTARLPLTPSSGNFAVTDLPFEFPFYGVRYARMWVNKKGYGTFTAASGAGSAVNGAIPRPRVPNTGSPDNAVYPFWDDLNLDADSGIYTATVGDVFVVEWRNVLTYDAARGRISVSAMFHRDGTVTYRYRGLRGERGDGSTATIGIENADGTDAVAYSVNAPVVREGSGVTFRPPAAGTRRPRD